MDEDAEKYLFEKMPVPKAVATLAIPTIISQVVTMIDPSPSLSAR